MRWRRRYSARSTPNGVPSASAATVGPLVAHDSSGSILRTADNRPCGDVRRNRGSSKEGGEEVNRQEGPGQEDNCTQDDRQEGSGQEGDRQAGGKAHDEEGRS